MYTNVKFIISKNVFIPNLYAIFFRDKSSMKDEIFNLTLYEAKQLLKQLELTIQLNEREIDK